MAARRKKDVGEVGKAGEAGEQRPTCPEPGIYEGVSHYDYLKWEAVSTSRLTLVKKSPAHLRYALDHGDSKKSDALTLGTAVHAAVLLPETFEEEYICGPDCRRGTKEWDAFEVKYFTKNVLTPADYCAVMEIRAAVEGVARVEDLLIGSKREVSMVWKNSAISQKCKGRMDAYNEEFNTIIDLKTTKDASPEGFAKSIFNYGYYRQAAFYMEGARACGLDCKHFIFVAVETEPPYGVALYELTDGVLKLGQKENADLLEQYHTCTVKNEWPSYSKDIQFIGIPQWSMNILEGKYGQQL